MNIPLAPIRYQAVTMGLAAYLDEQYVEMHILTDMGKNITVVCDKNSIFSVQSHIEQIGRDCPEILNWKPAEHPKALHQFNQTSLINEEKVAMYKRAAQLQHLLVTWVLVANGKQAQLYEYLKTVQKIPLQGANKHHAFDEKASHELLPLANNLITAELIDTYQLGHDSRGRSSSSNSPTHNTYEPHGTIETELKRRYMESIANTLQKACTKNGFDRLVIVAPARMIGELKTQFANEVQSRLVATLPKDLTHYNRHMLIEHVQNALNEARIE